MLKYENGYIFKDNDVYNKLKAEEVKRMFITMSRSGDLMIHIDNKYNAFLQGYLTVRVDRENYFEVVSVLKSVVEQNPKIELKKVIRKMVEESNTFVLKKRLLWANIYGWSTFSLLVLFIVSLLLRGVFSI